ncbi:ABC transporter permease [Pseudomonas orientalis]|uniref:ABC transporter permease n=1 Tax=Pseudomonas orientalis TaxID=76758 RepID=UPI003207F47D
MVALARQTLLYEWRRFLPAIIAVGFAGLLQLLQVDLVTGIFSSASVYITRSAADVWVGFPGTQSVNLGRTIDAGVEMRLRMDPDITRVEQFQWLDADWRGARDTGGVSVFVSGIETGPRGLMFQQLLSTQLRALLNEPGAVIVDRADLVTLGVNLGDVATINGRRVHVVGITGGLRALGGVNVLTSLSTARLLDTAIASDRTTYLVAKVRDPAQADAVAGRLEGATAFGSYAVWTAEQFAHRSQMYWIFDTGAGAGVLFMAAIVFLVGAVITSQTLVAAVAGSIREYATLNALGVGVNALRKVVMEQAFWVGAIGLLGSSILACGLFAIAWHFNVPVEISPAAVGACLLLSMILALVSGLAAIRTLRQADPASLLR